MKVSVLIPYYNDERFLRQSIESVLAQTFADFELVLVNHASADDSRAIARSFDDPRIVHVDMSINHGAGGGLVVEEFLGVARGEYVKFFCADDVMRRNCLRDLVGFMDSNPGVGLAFGDLAYVNEAGEPLGAHWFAERPCFSPGMSEVECLRQLAGGRSILPWVGSIVRRAAIDRIELDATLVMMFDMSVWAQLLLLGERIGFVDSEVVSYRIHAGQVSALGNAAEAMTFSHFEWQSFFRLFQRCPTVEAAKAIFPGEPYVERLETEEDIPLAVALCYVANGRLGCGMDAEWAYLFVHDYLQDPVRRAHAADRFGLTVEAFRALIRQRVPLQRKPSRWVEFRDKLLRRKRSKVVPSSYSL